jgi:hypothetical protein
MKTYLHNGKLYTVHVNTNGIRSGDLGREFIITDVWRDIGEWKQHGTAVSVEYITTTERSRFIDAQCIDLYFYASEWPEGHPLHRSDRLADAAHSDINEAFEVDR